MKFRSRVLATVLVLMSAAGAAPAADVDARGIAESNVAAFNDAFAHRRVDAIVSLFADDAMLVQPNGQVVRNPTAIREFWRNLIETGAYNMDIVDVRSGGDGSIVTTATVSDLKTVKSPQSQVMKYNYGGVVYSVFKRQSDGRWKAQVQQWSDRRNG